MTAVTMMATRGLQVFAGPANRALAEAVADAVGTAIAPCTFTQFPDSEVSVRLDTSVRGCDAILIQPMSPPVNDHLVRVIAFADACRRASASSITLVSPYVGYARADRRQGLRVPVMASVLAQVLEAVGIDHVIAVDVHSAQVEGFFRIPFDNLSAVHVLCDAMEPQVTRDAVIVAPDLGATKLATVYAQRLQLPMAVVHKLRRTSTDVTAIGLTGDVRQRRCIVVDDMITTGSTIAAATAALREAGALDGPVVAATHGILAGEAWDRLARAGVRDLYVTDSVPITRSPQVRVHVVSIATTLAAAIAHAHELTQQPAHAFGSG